MGQRPYSTEPMLRKGSHPVIGRFAIAVGNPDASDLMGESSVAIRITGPSEEWRSGMNNSPVFVEPAEIYAFQDAGEGPEDRKNRSGRDCTILCAPSK
jgi:catalase